MLFKRKYKNNIFQPTPEYFGKFTVHRSNTSNIIRWTEYVIITTE